MGLIKNMYVARTFIQPAQHMRDLGVRMKFSPMPDTVRGKRIVVVDDSKLLEPLNLLNYFPSEARYSSCRW